MTTNDAPAAQAASDSVPLFRKDALDAQRQKLHGDVFLTQPMSFAVLSLLLFGIVLAATIFLVSGSFARIEHVPGHLVPSKGLVKIHAHQFGTLKTLNVREGSIVSEGQLLAVVALTPDPQGAASPSMRALHALDAQQETLRGQVAIEQRLLGEARRRIESERAVLVQSEASLVTRRDLQVRIAESARRAHEDIRKLYEQGHASRLDQEQAHRDWLVQAAEAALREQAVQQASANLAQLDIEWARAQGEAEQRLGSLAVQQTEIDVRRTELERRMDYPVHSPIDGRVVAIPSASLGRSVSPQAPLMTLLPDGGELTAELFVPSSAVGFVAPGQEVRLLYDAFPYQRFGSFPATVTRVTETIMPAGEVAAPFSLSQSVYRVTARLDDEAIALESGAVALQSGMTLKANIVLERRSFLAWLLEPLVALGGRS